MHKHSRNRIPLFVLLMILSLMPTDTAAVVTGEEGLFSPVAPDTVIVLDISASMRLNPLDQMGTVNGKPDQPINLYGNAECSGTTSASFKNTPQAGYTTNCARYLIAQRAIFNVLDDNKDGVINSQDDASLNIRMGFYTFNSEVQRRKDIGTSYAKIFCGKSSCSLSNPYDYAGNGSVLQLTDDRYEKTTFASNTAIALALEEVKTYLNTGKAADAYRNCRQKFVILVTDGGDTKYCDGNGDGNQKDIYKRRRASVLRAKELADAGYKIFVIGLSGSLEPLLKRTMNWMAYHGGTDNPLVANTGNPATLNVSYFAADPCMVEPDNRLIPIPSSNGWPSGCNDDGYCGAMLNDPGYTNQPLEGYAFFSSSSTELETALKSAIDTIQHQSYAFSQSSIASSRVTDENFIYEASFQPNFISNKCPFWAGHLEKYVLDAYGNVGATASADAYAKLRDKDSATRSMWTYKSGALTAFTAANITSTDLGVENDTRRNEVVGFIRGEAAYTPNEHKVSSTKIYKLGDIFRASPVTVGTPNPDFQDVRDANHAFAAFRTANPRMSTAEPGAGKRIVVAGTNSGQLHAFRTSDLDEVWSFIPPNGLQRLKQIAHKTEPANQLHVYFVDGPISVADVWLGTGDGMAKSPGDWKTLLIVGEGRGANKVLWSTSASCETGFNNMYKAASGHTHYCGYYALNITNTLAPEFKWMITPTEAGAPYLGDPWSKIMIHRVKINGEEKWVGFLGGGHQLSVCSGTDCDKRGKGFFVIDLSNGNVLWSYTRADDGAMDYALPAPPTMVDTDLDGFTDTAYIGDLGGNIWRFKFCSATDGISCNTTNWTGSRFFQGGGGAGRVYGAPAVAKDTKGNLWLYWGTGDRLEPIAMGGGSDRIYAVKDTGGAVTQSNLENVTGSTYDPETSIKQGWFIVLAGQGEKVLAEPVIFGSVAYFTSYIPSTGGDVCQQSLGTARVYALGYLTAASATGTDSRSVQVGYGIPTAPIISLRPGGAAADLYVTVSAATFTSTRTVKTSLSPPMPANRSNLIFWRDRRLQ